MEIIALVAVFVILFALGVPIAVSIGLSTLATMLATMDFVPAATTIAQRMAGGLNSFALLAIPLFILSGQIMAQGGIARRLIEFSMALIGMVPGGLAFVNVISCTLFGAISGSSIAATTAVGSFMIPEMKKEGYDKNFAAAVTVTSATTGLLIPPSNTLIVYAVASGLFNANAFSSRARSFFSSFRFSEFRSSNQRVPLRTLLSRPSVASRYNSRRNAVSLSLNSFITWNRSNTKAAWGRCF